MIVVFDPNIWRSDLYKNSGASAATRFFLRQSGTKVAVPEVIRLEVETNLKEDLDQWIKAITNSHRQLLAVFGTLKEVVLPTEVQIQSAIREATSSLGIETIEIPFSLESSRAAFLKVVRKEPPCSKTQQFKDAVIWHDCLRLAEQDDVTLVTNDGAFFEDHKFDKGLAANLREEANEAPYRLAVLSNVAQLLERIRINKNFVALDSMESLYASLLNMAKSLLEANGFTTDRVQEVKKDVFATEHVNKIFLQFNVIFSCIDVRETGRTDAVLSIAGDVMYDAGSDQFDKVRTPEITLSYLKPDGFREEKRAIFLYAASIVGHRDVSHTVRYRL